MAHRCVPRGISANRIIGKSHPEELGFDKESSMRDWGRRLGHTVIFSREKLGNLGNTCEMSRALSRAHVTDTVETVEHNNSCAQSQGMKRC